MYYSLNDYCRKHFGRKLYKISLDGGFTCPNRDGTLGSRGCIFCSEGGSGDFAEKASEDIRLQIERGKRQVAHKMPKSVPASGQTLELSPSSSATASKQCSWQKGKYSPQNESTCSQERKAPSPNSPEPPSYIAYFQAYTNTYGPLERMRRLFTEAIMHEDIAVLSIATRPDCLPPEVLDLLEELNQIKPVWVELGLQTIHEDTARCIRRGYSLDVFDQALVDLKSRGIEVIVHVILGLPGETANDMYQTIRYIAKGTFPPQAHSPMNTSPKAASEASFISRESSSENITAFPYRADGIKLQLLHVLKNTDLAEEYEKGRVPILSLDEYLPLLEGCIRRLPSDMVIHRLTGDGPKSLLLAPLWTGNKRMVLNTMRQYFREHHVVQGSLFSEE